MCCVCCLMDDGVVRQYGLITSQLVRQVDRLRRRRALLYRSPVEMFFI